MPVDRDLRETLARIPLDIAWNGPGAVPVPGVLVAVGVDDLDALEAERDQALAALREMEIAVHGGCGCPAPYDECPHDEPLLPALNNARRELAALREAGQYEQVEGAAWDHQRGIVMYGVKPGPLGVDWRPLYRKSTESSASTSATGPSAPAAPIDAAPKENQ